MMKFTIKHQEEYSRGELLLRTFFGVLYIGLPHAVCLLVLGIWSAILRFLTFWIILFTGRFPENFFNYQLRVMRWVLRVQSRMLNLADGYPAFGLDATDDKTELNIKYTEEYNRMLALLVGLIGQLMVLPHILCVYFMMIGVYFVVIISWFAVLFTGKYPAGMHQFVVNTFRWMFRIGLYLNFMNSTYPPFSGKPDEELYASDSVLDSNM